MPQYLGLDSSTQSLSALLIDTDTGKVVAERSVNFGERLPHYKSPKGFLPSDDAAIKHSDPLMWVEALELVLQDLRSAGVDLGRVRGISGAGQQHGSVYLSKSLDHVGDWSLSAPLLEQVRPLLSRATSPIWMDSSTSAECAEIARAVGGDERVATITGSRATLRFTGPQIRRFYKTSPAEWQRTAEIHLVSSFIPSLLVGKSVSIDLGDGAGMNLLDLAKADWNDSLLDATAPGPAAEAEATRRQHDGGWRDRRLLREEVRLRARHQGHCLHRRQPEQPHRHGRQQARHGRHQPGHQRHGVHGHGRASAPIRAATAACSAIRRAVSCPWPASRTARSRARRSPAASALSWDDFASAIVDKTKPGNGGNMLLPYFVPEITPRVLKAAPRWFGSEAFVAGKDGAAAARAVVEAQALSMRLHSDWIGEAMTTVLVTGGASKNRGLLRVLADVFQATIMPLSVSNSSALGGALRAAQGVDGSAWQNLYAQFSPPDRDLAVEPNPSTRSVYQQLGATFEKRIKEVL
jgi:xylulokinase